MMEDDETTPELVVPPPLDADLVGTTPEGDPIFRTVEGDFRPTRFEAEFTLVYEPPGGPLAATDLEKFARQYEDLTDTTAELLKQLLEKDWEE